MRFNNKKEAWKKAIKIIKHWRDKEIAIFQDKETMLEVLLEMDMFNDKEDKISRSKYFVKFEHYPIGDYAVLRFCYRKRQI